MMKKSKLFLASQSPRRKEIMEMLKLNPIIMIADIDETAYLNEQPIDLVKRLSYEKAKAIANQQDNGYVIGSDTIVVVDNDILGKPSDEDDAYRMLKLISGRCHKVMTGVAIIDIKNKKTFNSVGITEVVMNDLSDEWIKAYIATGEPMDKAGSYGIQGIGSVLINSIKGECSTVTGLSIQTLIKGFTELGIDYFELIKP